MNQPRVLLVVPTLGERPEFLEQCLRSIRSQEVPADVVVVCPAADQRSREIASIHGAVVHDDPGSLPAAINAGSQHLADHHEFINWLGDDDLLEPGSLSRTTSALDHSPAAVACFGACRYISTDGVALGVSRAGRWAPRILAWGPDLIPQPGMLIRSAHWSDLGGLDESLGMAFDVDLLLRLRSRGEFAVVPEIVASFRWHSGSLTASQRSRSLHEAEAVKRRYLSTRAARLKWLWERPVRVATRVAAGEVERRARRAGPPTR